MAQALELPSREELAARQELLLNSQANGSRARYTQREERKSHPSQLSLLSQSETLCYNGNWTFVPKGAVLAYGADMKSRLNAKVSGKFLPFPEFLRRNPSWLKTLEVSIEEARGEKSLESETFERIQNTMKVLVTVNEGCPVSTYIQKSDSSLASNE